MQDDITGLYVIVSYLRTKTSMQPSTSRFAENIESCSQLYISNEKPDNMVQANLIFVLAALPTLHEATAFRHDEGQQAILSPQYKPADDVHQVLKKSVANLVLAQIALILDTDLRRPISFLLVSHAAASEGGPYNSEAMY